MSLPIGINFRKNASFVTDGTNETWSVTDPTYTTDALYPQYRNGVTFGYTNLNASAADRSNSVDARIAGIAYHPGGLQSLFRLDLPATGSYAIKIVVCDVYAGGTAHAGQYLRLLDDTTVLLTQDVASGFTTTALPAADIAGTQYSVAGIVAANMGALQTYTFATTILRLEIGDAATKSGFISHLYIEQAAAAGGAAGGAFNQTIIRVRGRR